MDKEREWRLREPADPDNVAQLAAELGVDPVLATLLINRGVKTFEEARSFFRPSLSALHDPFLMKDMDKAVARLEKAISSSEKILVYGDYDVDGTTAVALVYSFIHKLNPLPISTSLTVTTKVTACPGRASTGPLRTVSAS